MAHSVTEEFPHLQCTLDFQGHIKKVNTTWQQQLGIMAEHLLLTTFSHWVHSEDLTHTQQSISQLSEGKADRVVLENRLRDIVGKYRWFIWIMTASINKGSIYVMGLEMPAREKKEIYLRDTEQRYQTLLNTIPQGILVYEANGKISICNPAIEKMLGIKAEQLLGKNHWDLITIREDGSEFPFDSLPANLSSRTGKVCLNQLVGIYRPDHSLIWLSISSQPLPSQRYLPPFAVVSILVDYTEYMQLQENLRSQAHFLSTILETIEVGIAVLDQPGRLIHTNPTYCKAYGYQAEELLGYSFTQFLPPPLRQEAIQTHSDFLLSSHSIPNEHWLMQHHDGHLLNHPAKTYRFQDHEGNLFKIVTLITLIESENSLTIFNLTNNERWIRLLLRQLPITVLTLDRQGKITFIEGQHLEILGLTFSKIGQTIFQASPSLTLLTNSFQQALSGESFVKSMIHGKNCFKMSCLPLLKANDWVGTLIIFHDITEPRLLKLRSDQVIQELELLATYTSVGLIYLNKQKIIRANQESATILGYEPTDLIRLSVQRLFRTLDDYVQFQQRTGIQLTKDTSYTTQQWLRRKEGTYVYCKITVKLLGTYQKILWLLEPIKDFDVNQEARVNLSTAWWTTTKEILFVTDNYLRIRQVNSASIQFTGYRREELINKSLMELNAGQQSTQFYQEIMETLRQHGHWQGKLWQRHKNNAAYLSELRLQAYDTEQKNVNRYLAMLTPQESTFTDHLTGLASHQLFRHQLLQTQAKAQRNKKFFAILLISVDDITLINAKYGCYFGDELLCAIGQTLKSSVRDSDMVARYSGASFAISLEEITKPEDAGLVSQMILFKLTQPFYLQKQQLQNSVSIGVVVYPEDGTEIDVLLNRANEAMQHAKQQGGCQCSFHTLFNNPKQLNIENLRK
jgi:diguanylate cyclase (GGDEF)-like protein/PAS domain S-box-containing protein